MRREDMTTEQEIAYVHEQVQVWKVIALLCVLAIAATLMTLSEVPGVAK